MSSKRLDWFLSVSILNLELGTGSCELELGAGWFNAGGNAGYDDGAVWG